MTLFYRIDLMMGVHRFKREGIETVFDLLEMDDNKREELLALKTPAQLAEVAAACNSFPSIEVSYQIEDEDEISAGDSVTVAVTLVRLLQYVRTSRSEHDWILYRNGMKRSKMRQSYLTQKQLLLCSLEKRKSAGGLSLVIPPRVPCSASSALVPCGRRGLRLS